GERIGHAEQRDAGGRLLAVGAYSELDHPHPYFVPIERTKMIEILAARLPSTVSLRAYARARDAKARLQVPYSIFIGRTFDGPNLFWKTIRRSGYVATRIPFVRRQTTRRQAGLA
ncbi:MAG: hypothetical protein M3389_04620, partial [Actinomycetota bacterium]|nr:hypothetical protein [Actinomycetota bacterium]